MKTVPSLAITVVALFSLSCDKLDYVKHFKLDKPQTFGMSNFSVFQIDPNGRTADIEWKGYNKYSNFLQVRWEEMKITCGDERYQVDDRGYNLTVNGKSYRFDDQTELLVIRFGSGISVSKYSPSHKPSEISVVAPVFRESTKIYDNQ